MWLRKTGRGRFVVKESAAYRDSNFYLYDKLESKAAAKAAWPAEVLSSMSQFMPPDRTSGGALREALRGTQLPQLALKRAWFRRNPEYDPTWAYLDPSDDFYWRHPCNRFVHRQSELMRTRGMSEGDAYATVQREFEERRESELQERMMAADQLVGAGLSGCATAARFLDRYRVYDVGNREEALRRNPLGTARILELQDLIYRRIQRGDGRPLEPAELPKGLRPRELALFLQLRPDLAGFIRVDQAVVYVTERTEDDAPFFEPIASTPLTAAGRAVYDAVHERHATRAADLAVRRAIAFRSLRPLMDMSKDPRTAQAAFAQRERERVAEEFRQRFPASN
jgi:hypothetical protein